MHIIHLSPPSTQRWGRPLGIPNQISKHHIIRATYVQSMQWWKFALLMPIVYVFIVGINNRNHGENTETIISPHANNLGGFGNSEVAGKTWLRLKQRQQRNYHQPRPMRQKRSCPPSSGPSSSESMLAMCWQGWKAHSQLPYIDNRNKSSSRETAGNPFFLQVWEQTKCKKLSFWRSSTHILRWHLLSNPESLVQKSPTSIINHLRRSRVLWDGGNNELFRSRCCVVIFNCASIHLLENSHPLGLWTPSTTRTRHFWGDTIIPHLTLDYKLAIETPKTKSKKNIACATRHQW